MRIIRNILLWLLGVAAGIAVLLGAVMAASYAFTTDGSRPDPAAQFGGAQLEANGSCWQVPLIGGMLDLCLITISEPTRQEANSYSVH